MDPLGSDGLLSKGEGDSPSRVISRAERRRQSASDSSESSSGVTPGSDASGGSPVISGDEELYDLDWGRVKSGIGGDGQVFSEHDSSYGVAAEEVDEDFDIMDLPAPLDNPDVYGDDSGDDSVLEAGDDSSAELGTTLGSTALTADEDFVSWDIVFPAGEVPRLVVRAALVVDGDEDPADGEVPVVESSVELSAEDVDRLLKLSRKVEKYHSRSSRFFRRIFDWAMRRKFFAGATFAVCAFLGISEVVRSFS